MHTDHDAPSTDVNPQSIKQGYETDTLNVKTILYVPIALVFTFGLTYGVVTLIVNNLRGGPQDRGASELAAARNDASLKDRLPRVPSPRLEGLQRVSGDDPPYVKSSDPLPIGNSPLYHPEDMRPSSKHGKELGLQDYAWKDKDKGLIRMPIEAAVQMLIEGGGKDPDAAAKKLYDKVLKFEDKVNPDAIRANQPTPSNPQQGVPSALAPKAETKKGDHP